MNTVIEIGTATPATIFDAMHAEYQKKGEVSALLAQWFEDFADERDYDSVMEMFQLDSKAVNTARLELYAPFKIEGYDAKGTLEKRMYDKIAQRFNRFKKGVNALIEAGKPEAETTGPDGGTDTESEGGTDEPETEKRTEDQLWEYTQTAMRAAVSNYVLETELSNDFNACMENHLKSLAMEFGIKM
jgi:hypothetical protein